MAERRVLSGWKEIANYLARGIRTVQRWELTYRLPIHRLSDEAHSVFAYADEIDGWLERSKVKSLPYVRPTVIALDLMVPGALSDLKLALEGAKFNVLTAYTSAEVYATAAKFDVDAFVVDSVLLDVHPAELSRELRRLYPAKPMILVGDDPVEDFDAVIMPGRVSAAVEWLTQRFGTPKLAEMV
jgi:CheY-like chemotaxis protein